MTALPGYSHLINIAMALALGLLVGLQRGWVLREQAAGSRFAGFRTFALMGLAGGIAGILFDEARGPATGLLVAVMLLVLLGYERTSRLSGRIDGTSGVVALLTLASGFLVGIGERLTGTTIVVVMVLILAMRAQLHRWVRHLSEKEMISIARFALIALVILPLLPDQPYGPYDAWNPRKLWMVVVLVSGFSFAGYFAARMLGPTRAVIATAAAGSMVSSTAVTASLATRMRDGTEGTPILATGISAASVVMYLRVAVLTAALAPFALLPLIRLILPGMLVSLVIAGWYLRKVPRGPSGTQEEEVPMRNPFDLAPAFLLTALVMALTVAARWVLQHFGDRELALVLAVSGTVDVDSTIITMGNLPTDTLPQTTAALVLAFSVTLNTLFKAFVSASVGGWTKGKHGALPLVASAMAVIAGALVVIF
ncbi:MgtC/SapB family protein [Novosphingobium malaysiense]|uniref:Membrane protein n=1 Tax=Novosphingobium malaysiense TaxID=1348853 RepID=A0A0B1ZP30_9SPHN|nr:MgtC/SapB family protein [Novosphingobium malaysiense]KHK92341.1 membrane protein [Novosphingobium malaysiense]